jgi:hypothetical protein
VSIASLLSLISYSLAALLSAVFGVIYLARPRFMPYHQEALGQPWEEVNPPLRSVLLALMRTAGGGLLASGISVAMMLFFPFRAGEAWACYAIPLVALVTAAPALYATMLVRARTRAHTPVAAGAAAIVLIVAGVVASFF